MNHLHYSLNLTLGNTVQVYLDSQANVLLLDDTNYAQYKRGGRYSYFGGLVKTSPANIRPPHAGHWNLVIDLGGYAGRVNATVKVI